MADTKEVPVTECKFYIPKELFDTNVEEFVCICSDMCNLYAKKNHDYGDSFNKGMDTIGMAYGIGRLYDKMNRIITLSKVKAEVNDENIQDTLIDLACYSVMTLNYLKGKKNK